MDGRKPARGHSSPPWRLHKTARSVAGTAVSENRVLSLKPEEGQQHRTPDADAAVIGDQADAERGGAPQHQRGDERRLPADPVAVVAEERGAYRARHKADEVSGEHQQRSDIRIQSGK